MMRVAHIAFQYGTGNTGGAAIAATRLHKALLSCGVESHYVCVHQREQGQNVHELPQGLRRSLFLALAKLVRCVWKFTPYHRSICLNLIPMFGLEAELKKINPDVVHVQWMGNDACSFEQIERLPYRAVFNLHDLQILNAVNPHPGQDNRFKVGVDKPNSTRLERWLFNRKRRMIEQLRPSFIGPSEWVCDMCRASLIGKGCPTYSISNLVDPAFEQVGLVANAAAFCHSQFVILFGAYGGRGNPFKGFSDLVHALKLLPPEIKAQTELHIFGESAADCETEGVKTHFLGTISNPGDLIKVYQSADVFAFPSREETQGMSKIEALLCGLPVIAFDRTACAEGIEHGVTGYVAADNDFVAYANGLAHYFNLWKSGLLAKSRVAIAEVASRDNQRDLVLKKICALYADVCSEKVACLH